MIAAVLCVWTAIWIWLYPALALFVFEPQTIWAHAFMFIFGWFEVGAWSWIIGNLMMLERRRLQRGRLR